MLTLVGDPLGLLSQVQCGNGVLTHCLLILGVEFGVFFLDDPAQTQLGQFFRYQVFIKEPALDAGLVLHKGSDYLVQILPADTRRLRALGLGQALDLDLVGSRLFVDSDIAAIGKVATLAIVKARCWAIVGVLGLEL